MRIRIRIQQLKLMRIHVDLDPDTDPDPKPCLGQSATLYMRAITQYMVQFVHSNAVSSQAGTIHQIISALYVCYYGWRKIKYSILFYSKFPTPSTAFLEKNFPTPVFLTDRSIYFQPCYQWVTSWREHNRYSMDIKWLQYFKLQYWAWEIPSALHSLLRNSSLLFQ